MRIVSLLPGATEIVCEIGLGDRLVGVTHECDWPPFVRDLPKVTSTAIPQECTSREIDTLVRERQKSENSLYSLNLDVLRQLGPDLIITQALCEVCAVADSEVQAAAGVLPGQPMVVNLEPMKLHEVFESMLLVGRAAGVVEQAEAAVARLKARVRAVEERTGTIENRPRVVFLEWIDPPFCAGHWTPHLMRIAGGTEAIGRDGTSSRTVAWSEILQADPDVLVIACCGFDVPRIMEDMPILASQEGFRELKSRRDGRIYLIDGSAYFNRPGPRLVDGLEILANALHPQIHPLPEETNGVTVWKG